MAKTKKKSTKSSVKSTLTKRRSLDDGAAIFAGTGILFAAACVILLANMQDYENIKLLLIGFGAALLVFGGVIIGLAIKPVKK